MNEGSPAWMWNQIAKKRRCLSHKLYVKSVMADIQNDIAKEAITTGKVDLSKRKHVHKGCTVRCKNLMGHHDQS